MQQYSVNCDCGAVQMTLTGETLYNTNAMDWRVVSQYLLRKCMGNELPGELRSKSHFFYGRPVVTIDDDLPKRD